MEEDKDCILCFLTCEKQRELRKLAQVQEEKFENILIRYKEIFMTEFTLALKRNFCSRHKENRNSGKILRAMTFIYTKNKVSKDIEEFFDELIEIYKEWISGKAYIAIGKLKELLEKNYLISPVTKREKIRSENEFLGKKDAFNEEMVEITNKLFFRGRESNNLIYNSYDMFHIPYDKRYLVKNQRFSLSGYPLIYLNRSIEGIVAELEIKDDNFNDFMFSSFYFKKEADVYSLRNPFIEYYSEEELEISIYPKIADVKRKLFKLILSSVCSFEKRIQHREQEKENKYIFYEEYVIPQALTQVLRLSDYHGIYYPSTRVSKMSDDGFCREEIYNLAYFPEYRDKHYDDELYNNMKISNPVSYKNIEKISNNFDIGEYKNYIINREFNLFIDPMLENIIEIYTQNMLKYKKLMSNYNNVNETTFIKNMEEIENKICLNFVLKYLLDLKYKKRIRNNKWLKKNLMT